MSGYTPSRRLRCVTGAAVIALVTASAVDVNAGAKVVTPRLASVTLGPDGAAVVVDFTASRNEARWFAAALQESVERELSRFRRVGLVDKGAVDLRLCREPSRGCRVAEYARAGVDIVVIGTLREEVLDCEIYATWLRMRVAAAQLDVGSRATAKRLQPQLSQLIRVIVQTGGLLDRKPRTDPASSASAPPDSVAAASALPTAAPLAPRVGASTTPAAAPPALLRPVQRLRVTLGAWRLRLVDALRAVPKTRLVLVVAILMLCAPAFIASRLFVRAHRRTRIRTRSAAWSAGVAVAMSFVLVGLSWPWRWPLPLVASGWLAAAASLVQRLPPAVALAGGVLWATLALVVARFVFPTLQGFERTSHDTLGSVLAAWFTVAVQRLALVAASSPVFVAVTFVTLAAGVSLEVTALLVVPAAALFGCLLLFLLIDQFTAYLDDLLVDGSVARDNPWHRSIKKYLLGYVRRSGLRISERLLDATLFLPGRAEGVVSYGGGLARPRILVGPLLREVALGEPQREAEAHALLYRFDELPNGIISPCLDEHERPRHARQRARRGHAWRVARAGAPVQEYGGAPRLLGENATLLGSVAPLPADESVPLISNTSEDWSVVRELLTEHYAAFEKNLDEDAHDDTDPTHKDFLFGALLVELGRVMMQQSLPATIDLTLATDGARAKGLRAALGRLAHRLGMRFGSSTFANLADTYAALNHGRDHLIQCLYFMHSGDSGPLTARAQLPQLYRTSKELLEVVGKEQPQGEDRQLLRATPRNRLVWLSRFAYAPIAQEQVRRRRFAVLAAAALGVAALGTAAVRRALAYDQVYIARMNQMQPPAAPKEQGIKDGRTD